MAIHNEILKYYKSGTSNAFVITGNIHDYCPIDYNGYYDYLINFFNNKTNVIEYNPAGRGVVALGDTKDSDLSAPITFDDLILNLRTQRDGKVTAFVKYPEYILETGNSSRGINHFKILDLLGDRNFITSSNIILFFSESLSVFPEEILSKLTVINIPFPNGEVREAFIEEKSKNKTFEKKVTNSQLSKLTSGLNLYDIEDVLLLAEFEGKIDKDLILKRKQELISKKYGDVLELFDVEGYSFDTIGGYDELKKYHKFIVECLINDDSSVIPKGLLYVGPPGTGKTYFAKCFAGEAKINFVELKTSKILNKYVGDSEKNFEKALNCIASLTPCGVFIDELDQAFQRSNDDSNGVRGNIFGRLLNFVSDDRFRGKIVFIGASNYPNKIDEALKRPGRFDKKIPFLLPDMDNRIKTFKVILNKYKVNVSLSEKDYQMLGDATEKFTQAEIENIVMKSLEIIKREKKEVATLDDIIRALSVIKKRSNEKIEEMIKIALDEVDDLEFIPKDYLSSLC